ncbi:hypothetical protein ACP275_08G225700 [Erythranthe tilingii]
MHILTVCRGMKEVWAHPPFEGTGAASHTAFEAWRERCINTLNTEQLQLVSVILWKTWDKRNKFVHGEATPCIDDILSSHIDLFKQTQLPRTDHPSTWLPPLNVPCTKIPFLQAWLLMPNKISLLLLQK